MAKQYSTTEVSKIFNVTVMTIINWLRAGKIKYFDTAGGQHKFLYEDLIDFVKKYNYPMPDELKPEYVLRDKKYKILIAEDHKSVVCSLEMLLKTMKLKLEIEIARDGFEAGIKVLQLIPDLVILDARMPGADGDKIVEIIKSTTSLKDTKILVYTAFKGDGEEMMKLGADRLIVKLSKDSDVSNMKIVIRELLGIEQI